MAQGPGTGPDDDMEALASLVARNITVGPELSCALLKAMRDPAAAAYARRWSLVVGPPTLEGALAGGRPAWLIMHIDPADYINASKVAVGATADDVASMLASVADSINNPSDGAEGGAESGRDIRSLILDRLADSAAAELAGDALEWVRDAVENIVGPAMDFAALRQNISDSRQPRVLIPFRTSAAIASGSVEGSCSADEPNGEVDEADGEEEEGAAATLSDQLVAAALSDAAAQAAADAEADGPDGREGGGRWRRDDGGEGGDALPSTDRPTTAAPSAAPSANPTISTTTTPPDWCPSDRTHQVDKEKIKKDFAIEFLQKVAATGGIDVQVQCDAWHEPHRFALSNMGHPGRGYQQGDRGVLVTSVHRNHDSIEAIFEVTVVPSGVENEVRGIDVFQLVSGGSGYQIGDTVEFSIRRRNGAQLPLPFSPGYLTMAKAVVQATDTMGGIERVIGVYQCNPIPQLLHRCFDDVQFRRRGMPIVGAQGADYVKDETGWLIPTEPPDPQTTDGDAAGETAADEGGDAADGHALLGQPRVPTTTLLASLPEFKVTGVSPEGGITTFDVTYSAGYKTLVNPHNRPLVGSTYYFLSRRVAHALRWDCETGLSGNVDSTDHCVPASSAFTASTASAFVTRSGPLVEGLEKCPADSFGVRLKWRPAWDLVLDFAIPPSAKVTFRFVIDPLMGVPQGNLAAQRFDFDGDTASIHAIAKNFFLHGYGRYNAGNPTAIFRHGARAWKYAVYRPRESTGIIRRRPVIGLEVGFEIGALAIPEIEDKADLAVAVHVTVSNVLGSKKAPCHSFCDGIW